MKTLFRLLLVAWSAAACNKDVAPPSSSAGAGNSANSGGGAGAANVCLGTACEAQLWPRLALQLADTALSAQDVTFETDGVQTSASSQPGCPADFASSPRAAEFACIAGLFTAPGTKTARVLVRRPGKAEQSWDIELTEHNHCGANIAYVTLSTSGDEVTLTGPQPMP